jgi:GNAT superfamily N-acetyltransferase
VTVRTGTPEDWLVMRQLFIDAGVAAWSHILPRKVLERNSAPERWNPQGGADVLVADVDGHVAGFACVRASADSDAAAHIGEIDSFYTHPSVWGRGVGRLLMDAALARLRARGFSEATLWTEHRNHRPRQFYERAGWTLDGAERRREYHGTSLLELRYRRQIG